MLLITKKVVGESSLCILQSVQSVVVVINFVNQTIFDGEIVDFNTDWFEIKDLTTDFKPKT